MHDDYEHIKLCAARFVWPRREQPTPNHDGRYTTWAQWFAWKFGEDLEAFAERARAQKEAT